MQANDIDDELNILDGIIARETESTDVPAIIDALNGIVQP